MLVTTDHFLSQFIHILFVACLFQHDPVLVQLLQILKPGHVTLLSWAPIFCPLLLFPPIPCPQRRSERHSWVHAVACVGWGLIRTRLIKASSFVRYHSTHHTFHISRNNLFTLKCLLNLSCEIEMRTNKRHDLVMHSSRVTRLVIGKLPGSHHVVITNFRPQATRRLWQANSISLK